MPNVQTIARLGVYSRVLFTTLVIALCASPVATAAPAVILVANPASVMPGTSSTITWSAIGSTACRFTSGAGAPSSMTLAANGSFNTPVLNDAVTYTINCTGPDGTRTLSRTVSQIKGAACANSGTMDSISLSIVPSRYRGIAPLGVFFDATGTKAAATPRPYHDLEYRWDFGDASGSPVSGSTWNTGSRANISSRNMATGPVAAHVFESSGTYTIVLTVTDGTNTISNRCVQIKVEDPDSAYAGTKTFCISAQSMPAAGSGGCPDGAQTVQQSSFPEAIASYAKTGRRLLFKRGDTFTSTTEARITATGPGSVGAYGSGALPLIQMATSSNESSPVLSFSSRDTPKFSDWRVMDLVFDGINGVNNNGPGIGPTSGGVSQITLLRISSHNMATSFGFGGDLINYWNNHDSSRHTIDQLFIVDSISIAGQNTVTSCYNAGNRVAFLGNDIDGGGNPRGSHVTRFPYLSKAVISNNVLSRPGYDRNIIKLHAPYWNATEATPNPLAKIPPSSGADSTNYSAAFNGDGYSKQIVISDNKLIDHANPWGVSIGPQNSGKDERVKDVLVERNWFVATASSQSFITIWAAETTIRNNIFSAGTSNASGVIITQRGIEPAATNVRLYNNSYFTAYRSSSNEVLPFQIGKSTSNISVKNNLAYAPYSYNSLTRTISTAGKSSLIESNNTTTKQLYGMSPSFSSNPPSKPEDFKPTKDSYAIGGGTSIPVWSDFYLNTRPQGIIDMGAIEVP